MIGAGDITYIGIDPEKALLILMLAYAGYLFHVLTGILGLLLAKKKSLFAIILSVLLFILQLISFIHVQHNIVFIIINVVLFAIAYYYLHNAYKNFKA